MDTHLIDSAALLLLGAQRLLVDGEGLAQVLNGELKRVSAPIEQLHLLFHLEEVLTQARRIEPESPDKSVAHRIGPPAQLASHPCHLGRSHTGSEGIRSRTSVSSRQRNRHHAPSITGAGFLLTEDGLHV